MRGKITETEEGKKEWDTSISYKIGDRNFFSIMKLDNTHPLLDGDVGCLTLFDFEELEPSLPPLGRVKIGTILKIEKTRDIIHSRDLYTLEFVDMEDFNKFIKYMKSKRKLRSYIY